MVAVNDRMKQRLTMRFDVFDDLHARDGLDVLM